MLNYQRVRLFIAMIRIQAMSDMSMLVTDEADVMFESKHVFDILDPNTRISTLIQSEFDLAIQQNLVISEG